ncbi:hypothetical protein [Bradyrhizobium sp.]|uniref:hypothetical protein n=1 Tax=Bradyrhizobium sp. TaxID=376 RepID=UPI003C275ED4
MSVQQIFVLGTDGNLWLEGAPFGTQIPPLRTQVDGNVSYFGAFSAQEVLVLGTDGNLWLEVGPFGQVPLRDTSSFPPAASNRYRIDGSVGGFSPWSPSEIFVLGNDDNANGSSAAVQRRNGGLPHPGRLQCRVLQCHRFDACIRRRSQQ